MRGIRGSIQQSLEAKREAWVWDARQAGALRTCYAKAQGKLEPFQKRVSNLLKKTDPWWQEHASVVFLAAQWNPLGSDSIVPKATKSSSIPSAYTCGRCGKTHVSQSCP